MKIKISNKEYIGQCNTLSYIFYKKIFKTNILRDLDKLRITLINISEDKANAQEIADFYEILIKMIYILIYTKNQEVESFEKWTKEIKINDLTEELINETIETLLNAFVDEDVTKELEKIPHTNAKESIFPEHDFLRICLEYRLNLQDLSLLTYIDIIKIFLSANQKEQRNTIKKATQSDIDRLLS